MPPASVLKLVARNDLILVSLAGEPPAIRSLIERHAATPMDFAGACVTRQAEPHDHASVRTPDTDLLVY